MALKSWHQKEEQKEKRRRKKQLRNEEEQNPLLSPVLVQNKELHNFPGMSTKMMPPPLNVLTYFTTVIPPS